MMKRLVRTARVVGIVRPSNPHDRRRSMSPPQNTTSESGNDSSEEEDEAARFRLETETKKGQGGRSP